MTFLAIVSSLPPTPSSPSNVVCPVFFVNAAEHHTNGLHGCCMFVLQFVHLAFTVHTARTPVTTVALTDRNAFVTERVSPAVIVNGMVKTVKQVQQPYTTRIVYTIIHVRRRPTCMAYRCTAYMYDSVNTALIFSLRPNMNIRSF